MVLQLKQYNQGVWLPWQMADRLQKIINQLSRYKLWIYNWKTQLTILLKVDAALLFSRESGRTISYLRGVWMEPQRLMHFCEFCSIFWAATQPIELTRQSSSVITFMWNAYRKLKIIRHLVMQKQRRSWINDVQQSVYLPTVHLNMWFPCVLQSVISLQVHYQPIPESKPHL